MLFQVVAAAALWSCFLWNTNVTRPLHTLIPYVCRTFLTEHQKQTKERKRCRRTSNMKVHSPFQNCPNKTGVVFYISMKTFNMYNFFLEWPKVIAWWSNNLLSLNVLRSLLGYLHLQSKYLHTAVEDQSGFEK